MAEYMHTAQRAAVSIGDTVRYENERGGQLVLTGGLPYVLTGLDGLYPSAVYDRVTVKVNGQQGETPISGSFSPRTVTLRFAAVSEDREGLRQLCEQAAAVLSPTLSGTLTFDTPLGIRSLRVYPDGTPSLSVKARECVAFTVSLTAYEPLFTEEAERRVDMAAQLGRLSFPLTLTDGFIFSERTRSRICAIHNPGQAACGFRAVLLAEGVVQDPWLLHADSGRRLTLLRTLQPGEQVELLSTPTKKRAELFTGGLRVNAMGLLSPDSRFSQLEPGDNLLCCGAAASDQNLRVLIYYRPAFAL